MDQPQSLDQQIISGLERLEFSSRFDGEHLWLTFCLCGSESGLAAVAAMLIERGWSNTDGRESAFINPKKHIRKDAAAILHLACEVETLCRAHEVQIVGIDADTSPDVRQSEFVMLFHN